MSDTALKLVDEPATNTPKAKGLSRQRLRTILLVVIPALALMVGFALYLSGGRYISTDNAYVGAQKVLITPDISGKVGSVTVREGQHVNAGDELLAIDPEPFRLALAQAQAKLATVRSDFATLKTNYKSLSQLLDYARQNVELKRRDVERKTDLLAKKSGSQADVDTSAATLVTAQLQAQLGSQQLSTTLNQLQNNPDLPIEKFPAFMQAQAALDQAQRDLDHTVLRAPIAGIATQVDNIQLGRFVSAGTPVLSVIDDAHAWVDANPKETDLTYLRVGQHVALDVDAFPDRTFHGTVASVSPGTGAQFSVLPAQNASGNWVKVVQRVPVRIAFDAGENTELLRAGMSVNVEIDTKRTRSVGKLLGLTSVAKEIQP
ncbi:MAG: transporter [Xanthobacteraceae bacterium]|nr:transporter [Xanthobacteraceae bacterium]